MLQQDSDCPVVCFGDPILKWIESRNAPPHNSPLLVLLRLAAAVLLGTTMLVTPVAHWMLHIFHSDPHDDAKNHRNQPGICSANRGAGKLTNVPR